MAPREARKFNEITENLYQDLVELHKSLSKDGNPSVDQLRSVMKALQPLLDQSTEVANGNLLQLATPHVGISSPPETAKHLPGTASKQSLF